MQHWQPTHRSVSNTASLIDLILSFSSDSQYDVILIEEKNIICGDFPFFCHGAL